MNRERLLRLAEKLDTVPSSMFDLSTVVHCDYQEHGQDVYNIFKNEKHCGAAACAMGWCPVVFPEILKYTRTGSIEWIDPDKYYRGYDMTACELFDIPMDIANYLFSPGEYDDSEMHSPQIVAQRIREVVDEQE